MDLLVAHEDPSGALPSCFVSLPPAVAVSLAHDKGLHFVALRVVERPVVGGERCFYFGWDGGSSRVPGRLGINRAFANLVGLGDGKSVYVQALEHSPINANSSVCLSTESDSDYALISTTAEFVEGALLQQVKVLYPGLVFSLVLPGRVTVRLCVREVAVRGCDVEFIVVDPSVEVIVVPPDHSHDGRASTQENLSHESFGTFRALPSPPDILSTYPLQIVVRSTSANRGLTTALVRTIAPVFRGRPAVPVIVCADTNLDVPTNHAFVPPHVWWELGLNHFVSISILKLPSGLVEEGVEYLTVSSTALTSKVLQRDYDEARDLVASYFENVRIPYLAYEGMPVIDGMFAFVGLNGGVGKSCVLRAQQRCREPLIPRGPHDSPQTIHEEGRGTASGMLRVAGNALRTGADTVSDDSTVLCVLAWSPVEPLASCQLQYRRDACDVYDVSGALSHPVDCFSEWTLISSKDILPSSDVRGASFKQNIRHVLNHMCDNAALSDDDSAVLPRLVVIRGARGSGKTTFLRSLSSLLRISQKLRTVWVRWRVHAKESVEASVSRIEEAFAEAHRSHPALIVFDDFDARLAGGDRTSDILESEKDSKEAEDSLMAGAFVRCLRLASNVRVLVACETDVEFDTELRQPGIVTLELEIQAPSYDERVSILSSLISRYARSGEHAEVPLRVLDGAVVRAASASAGFMPDDLKRAIDRAVVSRLQEATGATCFSQILESTFDGFVPRSKIGLLPSKGVGHEGNWDSIGGLWAAKAALREMLELPAKHPSVLTETPVRLPRGALLYGPPGCGKTMLGLSVAKSCGLECIPVKGPELLSKYIGESEAEVRRLFRRASMLAPCVIVFDEFDAVAPRRGGETTGVSDRVVNTLLTCLDGVERLSCGVYVVATTSHPELIDPAILRPGRIDRLIHVDYPGLEERIDILRRLSESLPACVGSLSDIELRHLGDLTADFSGADLRGTLREAQVISEEGLATSENRRRGAPVDFDSIVAAAERSGPSLNRRQRTMFASALELFQSRLGNAQSLSGKAHVKVALG